MLKRLRKCHFSHQTGLDDVVCSILREFRRIAVVGLSDDPWRDSNYVAAYMMRHGYAITPVNPNVPLVFGRVACPNLRSAPGPIEVVEIFRRREYVSKSVEEAIQVGARAVWIEGGFADESVAEHARRAGLRVVMQRCMMIEHDNHLGGSK